MAIIGSTIILRAEFYDAKTNEICDPTSVEVNIYDTMKNQAIYTKLLEEQHKRSEGVYEFSYVVPDGRGHLIYEFLGIIDGNPAVARGIIERSLM